MPELPDVTIYVEALSRMFSGRIVERVTVRSPFLLRTADPDVLEAEGKHVLGFRRLGKRIVWELEADLWLVFHLMIAGRFHCRPAGRTPTGKRDLAAFAFDHATLMLTEASPKKRASLHVVRGLDAVQRLAPDGLEIDACSHDAFRAALLAENRTLKRALTNPHRFSGIGNAYSDEILHRARLSPIKLTQRLDEDEVSRLYTACQAVLREWTERLRDQFGDKFPEKVTAFRPEMAVHGKFGEACPDCGTLVQRIVYAENETNYCPRCQTDGRVLADRSLSRLLKDDWPRRMEDWEGPN